MMKTLDEESFPALLSVACPSPTHSNICVAGPTSQTYVMIPKGETDIVK